MLADTEPLSLRGNDAVARRTRRVVRAALRTRDGDACWVCGRPTRRDVPPTHPDAETIDHIIERHRGGPDELRNLALAHLRCNQRRSLPTICVLLDVVGHLAEQVQALPERLLAGLRSELVALLSARAGEVARG